jgi:hypothetical protein
MAGQIFLVEKIEFNHAKTVGAKNASEEMIESVESREYTV